MTWATANQRIIIGWAIGLAVLACFVFIGTQAHSYAECQARAIASFPTKYQPGVLDHARVFFVCGGVTIEENGELLTALGTLAIAAFTLTLWLSSKTQAELTVIAIEDARLASQRENRAYVEVLPKEIVWLDRNKVAIVVYIHNAGQTPAFDTRCLWDVGLLKLPLDRPFRFQVSEEDAGKPVPTWTLYPGRETKMPKEFELTDEVWTKVNARTHAVYAYGQATYRDAFGHDQFSEFCAFLDAKVLRPNYDEAGRMSIKGEAVAAGFKFTEHNNGASRA